MNGYNNEERREINNALIDDAASRMLSSGKKVIRTALKKKVSGFQDRLKKIPEVYQNMKNNLTNTNNKEITRMNENIANTGNHNAGGYAISKRLNNINSFNKAQSDIDKAKQNEISDIENKISDAKSDAEIEIAKLNSDAYQKQLDLKLDENNRTMEFALETDRLNETKRMNDSAILKNNNDILLSQNEDRRKEDENTREWELHNIETEYLPLKYGQEIENLKADNRLTEEKIKTESIKQTSKGSSGSGSAGSSKAAETVLSKMSAKDLAQNLINQVGKKQYDSYGNAEIKYSKEKVYVYLMEWKKKYNLPDYIVNDTAIILGIQDFI